MHPIDDKKLYMKKTYLAACISLLLAACTQAGRPKEDATPPVDTALQAKAAGRDSIPQNVQQDSTIRLTFLPGSDSLTATGHLDDDHAPVICYLPVAKPGRLKATIVPDKQPANIRFNQVFLPDGSSDGPFGQTLDFRLPQKGMYKIHIGPSLMANDAYTGNFRLHVKVE